MKEALLIGISYCGTHNKGDALGSPQAVMVPPAEHAEWLLEAVDWYQKWTAICNMMTGRRSRLVVTATGTPAFLKMDASGERNAMWEVARRCDVIAHPDNPGHQVGACIALRQGLEAAGCWGYPLYLHTAEDILPLPGAVEEMVAALDEGNNYAGYCWTDMLNCAFFGCRTKSIAGVFDYERVREYPGLEHYLFDLFKNKTQKVMGGEGRYLTTHDHAQYQRWLRKLPDSTHPPVVRVMSDYDLHREYLEREGGRE